MKIAYITAQVPYGRGETFIIGEMLAIKEAKVDLLIIPRSPTKKVFHKEAKNLLPNTIWLPLINLKIVYIFLISLFAKPRLWKILLSVVRNSRTLKILVKNLIVIPKGVFIANLLWEKRVNHIHAHWGSTTATMAWIVSKLTGIPWSFTLHRWDIKESNMLRKKIKSAKFSRCISENGKNELLEIIGTDFKNKIKVIHMGVKITINVDKVNNDEKKYFRIITPANLLAVKGHKYLIEACSILVKEGMKNFECIFYGKGLMRSELKELIKKKLLNNYIKMLEMIPHEKLMGIYKSKKVDIVILPSVKTKNGEHEGIPVALMEAMAYSIPVISTNTGGIPELLSDKAGVIVEERNSQQLAVAIKKFIKNKNFREKIGRQGYERVCKEFNTQKNTKKLVDIFKYYS
jgi:glycosyltransferase involved in cell wall biosynthesis